MADLAHAASSRVSYYDMAASASSLSFLASKAQRSPLSKDEWDQFTTTTEQLRKAFLSLHGRSRSPSPSSSDCVTSAPSSSTCFTTTTAVSPSASVAYSLSPMSSPSPSPLPASHRSLSHAAEDKTQLWTSLMVSVDRKPRSRAHKECAHCGTAESSQWRRGPFDKAMLCNACGLRYSRNFAKKKQQKSDRHLLVQEARHCSSPPTATTIPDTTAESSSSVVISRSDIYDLLN